MTRSWYWRVGVLLLATACGDVRPTSDAALAGAAPIPATSATDPAPAEAKADNGIAVSAAVVDPAFAEGLRLYREQYCGTCHAFAAAGTGGIFGPPHDDMRSVAEQRIREAKYAGRATTAEEYLRESLLEPGAYRVPGYERTRFLMPAYTNLSDAEIDALVRLLLDLPRDGGT